MVAVGVQSYRLQGTQAERDILTLEKTERARRDAMRDVANMKNKERTDAEYATAKRRAALARVRLDGPGIRPATELAGGGDERIACFDRGRLNEELAGFVERHAGRLSAVAGEGEGLAAALRACRAWALNVQ